MHKTLRALIVEDNDFDVELLLRALRQNGYKVEHQVVQNQEELKATFAQAKWDIVFSDYNIPGYGAMEALQDIRKIEAQTPVIIVSGAVGEDNVVEILKAGADDFIVKGKWNRLPAVVNRAIREREIRATSEEARRAREQILAVVSHDLRNPLAAIKLNIEAAENIVAKNNDTTEEFQRLRGLFDRIKMSLGRVVSMVDDILDETKVSAGRFKITPRHSSVHQFVEDLTATFVPIARTNGVTITLSPVEKNLYADFDYERLFQAIGNLISNAIKFTPKDGHVDFMCRVEGESLRFSVADTGKGIPRKFLPLIFERFWQGEQASRSGVGLGLFIVKGIVTAHDGKVSVQSIEGQGTQFTVEIPLKSALTQTSVGVEATTEKTPDLPMDQSIHPQKPFLLIEDDEDVRLVLRDCLESFGAKVLDCESLKEATNILTANDVELILTDYQLAGSTPQCLMEFLRSQPQTKSIPVILLSAETHLEERARELGIDYWVRKPFERKVLFQQVCKALPASELVIHG